MLGKAAGLSRRGAGDRGDRGVLALSAEVLGHAYLLEPHGGRLALRDRVHRHSGLIRPANFPCPLSRCFDADRDILPIMSVSRVVTFACCLALAPIVAFAGGYRSRAGARFPTASSVPFDGR